MESVYKLSVLINMIDNLTSPMAKVKSSTSGALSSISSGFAGMASAGSIMAAIGVGITTAALSTVSSTFETQDALAELASLGVQDLQSVEDAARKFSDTWAGTTKSDFISAAYDIKSGISSLSDEGVAEFTELSGLTAKATKSTVGEMTSLFATGYGIYKDYYGEMSDLQFGEMFSAGIASAVKAYKTTGSEMASSISALGASATTSNVPFEEQLSILGMLQATMSGGEAGTKYKAFLNSASGAGKALKLSFTDANNQLLSMPEILGQLKGKYGETLDAMEKQKIKEAFGTDEAVGMIELLYGKTDTLQANILDMYDSLGSGTDVATQMADAINSTESQKFIVLKQQIHNVSEELGQGLLPTVNGYMAKAGEMIGQASSWVSSHQEIVAVIMNLILKFGVFLTVLGVSTTVIGAVGGAFVKTMGFARSTLTVIKGMKSGFETMRIYGMLAGDKVSVAFKSMKGAGATAITAVKNVGTQVLTFAKTAVVSGVTAVKNFVISMASMAKQAIVTAVTALPGLIAGVWSFTAALLANPITWIVIGVIALIAAIVALVMNWDKVVQFLQGAWKAAVSGIIKAFTWIKEKISSMPAGFKILIAVMFPFIAIPILIIKNWKTIITFFKTLPANIGNIVTTLITNVKTKILSSFTWFKNSGKKIMDTFTEGIKGAISKPVDAVKNGLAKIRKMLPFSDAKEGPLSTLTLSGKRVFETINTGMTKTLDLPSKTTKQGLKKVATELTSGSDSLADTLNKKKSKKVSKSTVDYEDNSTKIGRERNREGNTIIQSLKIVADIKDMKDLPLLYKLIDEIKDAKNRMDDLEPAVS